MQVVPPALERLIGRKSATRLSLAILRKPSAEALELAEALAALHASIRLCGSCFTFSESDPCAICADGRRDRRLVCVVEESGDLIAIEKTGAFRGVYHILHGVLAPMDGIGPDELKIKELVARVASREVEEVLIATSSTVPGEATASFLMDRLQNFQVKVTRLACGIPMGMDIKYADEHTLARAIESRQHFS
jgi:recombination protein RecR